MSKSWPRNLSALIAAPTLPRGERLRRAPGSHAPAWERGSVIRVGQLASRHNDQAQGKADAAQYGKLRTKRADVLDFLQFRYGAEVFTRVKSSVQDDAQVHR